MFYQYMYQLFTGYVMTAIKLIMHLLIDENLHLLYKQVTYSSMLFIDKNVSKSLINVKVSNNFMISFRLFFKDTKTMFSYEKCNNLN